MLQDHVPSDDAPAVAALRAAGAVIVGKTNVPRWCNAETETHNELFRPSRFGGLDGRTLHVTANEAVYRVTLAQR